MNLLLDTHAFLWWIAGDRALPGVARDAIDNLRNKVFVSAASAWEIATKVRIGKLPGAVTIATNLAAIVEARSFVPLPVTIIHGQTAGSLPGPHRDPFDRVLIAQAMIDDMFLVSNEQQFDRYGVRRLW